MTNAQSIAMANEMSFSSITVFLFCNLSTGFGQDLQMGKAQIVPKSDNDNKHHYFRH